MQAFGPVWPANVVVAVAIMACLLALFTVVAETHRIERQNPSRKENPVDWNRASNLTQALLYLSAFGVVIAGVATLWGHLWPLGLAVSAFATSTVLHHQATVKAVSKMVESLNEALRPGLSGSATQSVLEGGDDNVQDH